MDNYDNAWPSVGRNKSVNNMATVRNLGINKPSFECNNMFSVLNDVPMENPTSQDQLCTNIIRPMANKKIGNVPTRNITYKQHKSVRIFADSHGRGLAEIIKRNLPDAKVCGNVKPGAKMCEVMENCNPMDVKEDIVILMGGANNVACNEGDDVVANLRVKIPELPTSKVFVVNVPKRRDLIPESCVNKAVTVTNRKIDKLCRHFKNACVVDVSNFGYDMYTVHGMHLNLLGKEALGNLICTAIKKELVHKPNNLNPIALKWHEQIEQGNV